VTEDLNDILQIHGPEAGKALLDGIIAKQRQKKLNGSGPPEERREEEEPVNGAARREEPAPKAEKQRFEAFDIDSIEAPSLETAFFIDGLMPRRGVEVFYGPSSVGKTFVVLHKLLHVATGRKYAGRHTEKGLVIYVTGEGQQMFRNRIWLAKNKLGIKPGEAAFRGITDMNMARNDTETKALLERIKQIASEPQYAGLPVVTVIDTVSTALKGAKEDEVGLGAFISNSILIAAETDGVTLVIHHTGKDATNGPRGSYVTIGNSDAVTRVEENEGGTGGSIITEKMRDGPKDLFWTFERRVETLGKNQYGSDITSCYIELTSEPKFLKRTAQGKRGKGDIAFDEAFNEQCHAHGFDYNVDGDSRVKVRAVAMPHLREEFNRRYATGESGEDRSTSKIRTAFGRALTASFSRYRTRTVTIESDADVTRYGLTKELLPKPKDGRPCEVEIMWLIKHEPKPLAIPGRGDETDD
jgi:hypothetical protein